MGFVNGKTYRFINKYYSSHALNVFGTNAASTGRNVCLFKDDDTDIMQDWVVKTSGSGYRMHSAVNQSFVLDCSDGSMSSSYKNNAHLCATSQTSTKDSQVEFKKVSDNVYKIYLPGKGLYLTATNTKLVNNLPASSIGNADALAGGTGGLSNVYWASNSTSTKQQWIVSPEVDDSGSSGEDLPEQNLAVPINNCVIQCGYHNPGKRPASEWQQCELYATLGNFAKAGHFGMDFTEANGQRTLYASGNGVVLGLSSNSNNIIGQWIAIKYFNVRGYGDIIARYFHLGTIFVSVGQKVDLNTKIANYGATGNYVTGAHLHIELDSDTKAWNYTPTLSSDNGGLCAGIRGANDTTLNPAHIFKLKTSSPENQTMIYPELGWYSGPRFSTFK